MFLIFERLHTKLRWSSIVNMLSNHCYSIIGVNIIIVLPWFVYNNVWVLPFNFSTSASGQLVEIDYWCRNLSWSKHGKNINWILTIQLEFW